MPDLKDPCPVKAWDVVVSWPGRAVEPLTLKARTLTYEGGVLTLRGTADHMSALVVAYGPRHWIKAEPHACRWNLNTRQPCKCGEPFPPADQLPKENA